MKITYISLAGVEIQENSAPVNRSRSFVKGLKRNEHDASILFIHTKKINLPNKIVSFFKVGYFFIKARRNEIIILNCYSPIYFLMFIFKYKLKFIIEENEYPLYLRNPYFKKSKFQLYIEKHAYQNIDGFITCSMTLKNYFKQFLKVNTPIFVSPLIIDLENFEKRIGHSTLLKMKSSEYIGYCGSLNNNKDGVPTLISSFSLIANRYPNLKLYIAGTGSEKVEQDLEELVDGLNLNKRVVFLGNVPHKNIPSFLGNAKVLALARPNNKQAEGGFPSKLGEYMAAKVPIVITNVGELKFYLKDNFNCYMSEPDSAILFSEKLIEALENNNDEIVSNAYRTVAKFNYIEQSKSLLEFLKSIH